MSAPVLLIPGLACNHVMWSHQVENLSTRWSVTVADLPPVADLTRMAERILMYAPPQFHLVAASMGGYIAFEIMKLYPARVMSLGLVVTTADRDTPQVAQRRLALNEAVAAGRWKTMWRAIVPRFLAEGRRRDSELINRVCDQVTSTSPEAFLLHMDAMRDRDPYFDVLPGINVPTCVFIGDDDEIIFPRTQLEMASRIPRADVRWIKSCGHIPTMERPEATTALLDGWLRSLERQAA